MLQAGLGITPHNVEKKKAINHADQEKKVDGPN